MVKLLLLIGRKKSEKSIRKLIREKNRQHKLNGIRTGTKLSIYCVFLLRFQNIVNLMAIGVLLFFSVNMNYMQHESDENYVAWRPNPVPSTSAKMESSSGNIKWSILIQFLRYNFE